MELINASHNFKPTFVQQFKANQDENVSIDLYLPKSNLVFTYPLKDFRLFFTDSNIETVVTDDDEELIFMTADKTLKMVGIDYKWAIEPVRGKKYGRLTRLLSENVDAIAVEKPAKSKTKTSSTKTYYAEIATCENNVISDIKPFNGNEKEVIAFLNKEYSLSQLRSFFASTVVFKISTNEDLTNVEWKTMKELVDEGVIEI